MSVKMKKIDEESCQKCVWKETEHCQRCTVTVSPSGKKGIPSGFAEECGVNPRGKHYIDSKYRAYSLGIGQCILFGRTIPVWLVERYNDEIIRIAGAEKMPTTVRTDEAKKEKGGENGEA